MPGHRSITINDIAEARAFLANVGVDEGAYQFLTNKAVFRAIMLKDISCRAAHIIKQEMLGKGGEAAIGRQALTVEGFSEGKTDILLLGNLKQYRLLNIKLKMQPFGLKKLALEIESLLDNLEKKFDFINLPSGKILDLSQTVIMGILNITPDSFFDGNKYLEIDTAVGYALKMVDEGAEIIDIGAVSTKPDAVIAGEQVELNRLIPIIKALKQELPKNIIISIDTFRAEVAKRLIELGADMINDIGALHLDENLSKVISDSGVPVVLMHNRLQLNHNKPYNDLIADMISEIETSIAKALSAGVKHEKIIVDPGLGFGKTVKENCRIVNYLADFKSLGRPILVGGSRKAFIGQTLQLDKEERLEGSLAVAAAAILNGAQIIRTHDVKATKRLAQMLDAVNKNG